VRAFRHVIRFVAAAVLAAWPSQGIGQEDPPRWGLAAGMGVCYADAADVVDIVNSTAGLAQRVSQFKAAVEFFGAFTVPVNEAWTMKLDYGYLLGSYNVDSQLGPAEYTLTCHLPSVIAQYTLMREPTYNVKVGGGAGYHIGTLAKKFVYQDVQYTATGVGIVLDAEANTAFGDHLYAYLGGNLRWEMMGALADANGRSPGVVGSTIRPALHMFGAGARLGLTYFF
jgi:hypothetical protein